MFVKHSTNILPSLYLLSIVILLCSTGAMMFFRFFPCAFPDYKWIFPRKAIFSLSGIGKSQSCFPFYITFAEHFETSWMQK